MKSLLRILISISVVAAPFAGFAEPNSTPPVQFKMMTSVPALVRDFITKHSRDEFAYRLTSDEFAKALEDSKGYTDGVFNAQASKVLKMMSQPEDSLVAFHRAKAEQALAAEAHQLVDNLINDVFRHNRPVSDLNMLLITLAHDYAFDSINAGPLDYLINAINEYHFSEPQLAEIRKQSSDDYRMARAQYGTYGLYILGSAIGLIKYGPAILQRNFPGLFRGGLLASLKEAIGLGEKSAAGAANKSTITSAEKSEMTAVAKTAETSVAARTIDEKYEALIKELEEMESHLPTQQTLPSELRRLVENMTRSRVLRSMDVARGSLRWLQKYGILTNLKLAVGLYAAGKAAGGIDILGHALFDKYVGETVDNSYININDEKGQNLRSDYFDGLAILNLSCKSRALVYATQSALNADDHLAAVKKLNGDYVDYVLYKNYAPRYDSKVTLPEGISVDPATGIVSYKIQIKDRVLTDHFACAKLKGSPSTRIEVSLTEVLYDLMLSYKQLLR